MSPRAYNTTLRKEIESETIRRIVAATVELHARKGALATTHADIAEHAGVSVATVYKHFPSREALLPHCTGMVAQQAPQIDPQAILAGKTGKERISRLVRAVYQQYRYFHPWMRWTARDAHSLPFLARRAEDNRHKTEALARAALDNAAGLPVTDEAFALAMAILDYSAWQRLENLLSDPERVNQAAEQALQLLMSKLPHQQSRK